MQASTPVFEPSRDDSFLEEAELIELPASAIEADPASMGTLVALMGSKGGCGVTLLTVNLGAELASGKRVCAIDLAGARGDVAAYLDLECRHEIAELIEAERIDAVLLDGLATRHRSGIAVLPQPTDLAEVTMLEADVVRRMLRACQIAYDVVLVDCGTSLDEATLTAVMQADIVALVSTPDVPAVRDAHRHLQLLDRLRVDRDRVRLVLNQSSRHQQLSVVQIEEQLHHEVAALIRADAPACARSHLTGQLLKELSGRHPIDQDISRLWPALLGHLEETQKQPGKGKLASWLQTVLTMEAT